MKKLSKKKKIKLISNKNIKFEKILKEMAKLMDQPIRSSHWVYQFYLRKLFKKRKIRVIYSGDGADEILAGYDPFLAIKPAQFYNKIIPRPVHSFILKLANCLPVSDNQLSFDFKIKKTLNALSYPKSFNCPIWMSILDPHEINDLFMLGNIVDPDILIRTGGYRRLSNFIMYNLTYTELFFTDTLWPDFSIDELKKIIEEFSNIDRKYGL